MSRFLVLLLALACSHRAERQDGYARGTARGTTGLSDKPSGVSRVGIPAALSAPLPRLDSITSEAPWQDSSKVGDTTNYSRGRVFTTITTRVKVVTDTQWRTYPLPAILPGIPYGLTGIPPESLCTSGFTSTVYGIPKAGTDSAGRNRALLTLLAKVRPCRGRVWLRNARVTLRDSVGHLSVKNAVAEIKSWPQQLWTDSAVIGFHLGDDPADTAWGGTMAQRMAKFDTVACSVKARGTKPRLLRARAVQMAARPNEGLPDSLKWRCMTTSGTQWVVRLGDPDAFFAREEQSARSQKLGMMVAFNLLQGDNDRPLSATLIRQSGAAALRLARACAFNPWAYPPAFGKQYTDTSVVSALTSLRLAASVHPATSCIQR